MIARTRNIRPRGRRWRRLLVAAVVLVGVLALALVFAPVLFGPWLGRVIGDQLATQLGGTWEVGRVERLALDGITLTDLRQTAPGETGAVRACTIDSVAVSWSPAALIDDPVAALRSLSCSGLDLDLAADRPLVVAPPDESESDPDAPGGDPLGSLHPDIRIDLSGRIRASWGDHACAIEQLTVHGSPEALSLTVAPWSFNGAELEPLHARWTSDAPGRGGTLVASLPVLGEVEARAVRDGDWRLQANGAADQGRWQARSTGSAWSLAIDNLDLEPSFAGLERGGLTLPPWLTASSRLWLEASGADDRAAVELRLLAGESDPRPGLTARLDGAWNDGQLRLDTAQVRTDAGDVRISGLHWSPRRGITALTAAAATGWRVTALDPLAPPELRADLALVDEQLRLAVDVTGGGDRIGLEARADPNIATAAWADARFSASWDAVHELPLPRRGTITASGRASGTPGAPRAQLALSAEDLHWSNLPPTDLHLTAELEPGAALLRDARVRSGDHRAELPEPVRLSWSADGWRLQPLRIDGFELTAEGTAAGVTRADLRLASMPLASLGLAVPALAELSGSLRASLQVREGELLEAELALDGLGAVGDDRPPVDASLRIDGGADGVAARLRVREADGEDLANAQVELARPFAARWDWAAELASAPLAGRAELLRLPLAQVAPLVPAIVFARGHLSGSAELTGSVGAPQAEGELRFDRVDLGTGTVPPITELSGTLRLSPEAATTDDLRGHLGYAPLRVSGRFSFDTGEHDLALAGERILLVEDRDLRVRADLDCRLTGPRDAPRLAGRVGITEFLYTADTGWLDLGGGATGAEDDVLQLFSIDAEPWSRMRFDLEISDGSLGAEATSRGLDIRMPLFQGAILIDLRLGGNGAVPEPVGVLTTTNARAVLPFTTYRVESATVRFDADNPFEPTIVATLTTRMAGYDVRLVLEGPISDPRLSVTTSPPLPGDEAVLLATTGLPPSEADDGSAALGTALSFLAKELGRKLLGPGDPDAEPGFLSRFELRLDEDRSESGLSTARVEFRMIRRWYLFAERDRFEDYNGGLLYRFSFGRPGVDPDDAEDEGEDDPPDPDAEAVEWQVRVAEGSAGSPLSAGALLDLVRRHRRAFDRSGDVIHAADAAATMERAIRDRGHPDATVALAVKPDAETPRAITFTVAPARHWVWGEVSVDGAPPEHAERIREITISHLDPGSDFRPGDLDAAADQIGRHLELDGYATPEVDALAPIFDHDRGSVTTAIRIRPGTRHTFAPPTLTGGLELAPTVERAIRERLDDLAGEPWLERTAVLTRAAIQGELHAAGHQWATTTLILPGDEGSAIGAGELPPQVPVAYHLEPGPVVQLAELKLMGFEHTADSYLRDRLGLQAGDILEEGVLERGLSRVRRTVPLRRLKASLEPAAGDGDEAVLVVEGEEASHHHVEVEAGYGSYVGPFAGLRYRNENLLGYGRQWSIGGMGSEKMVELDATLVDRDLLGGDRQLSLLGEIYRREEPSFTDTRALVEPAATFPLTQQQRLRIAYRVEWSRAEDVEGAIPGAEIDGLLRTARLDAGWKLKTYADPWLPTQGWSLELGGAVADQAIGSQLDFVEARAGAGVVLPILDGGEGMALALHVHGTTRQPTDDRDTLPIQERLFLGGANSVRSFGTQLLAPVDADGDAVGGLTATYAQAELRFRLIGRLHAAAFYDVGSVDPDPWSVSDEVGQAVGAGLRLNLPIGPLRVDGAYNPDGETFAQDERWAVHLAVGYTF